MNNNVCKFPPAATSRELSTTCFVLETDIAILQKALRLKHNRMILIESGEGAFAFDGLTYDFETGTLLFGFEGESFSLVRGESVRALYIDFGGVQGELLLRRFGLHPHARKIEKCNALIPFCKNCLLSTPQENVDVVSESVLLYVFSQLSSRQTPKSDTVQRIVEYTKEHFQNPELSVTLIAKTIGYNPKYLSHFFKEKMGVSYSEYLRSLRFRYAISLFELGISSVKNVALLSGFSDPLYFSNAFKKEIGLSPKEFIRECAEKSRE